jgi:hypothetical protein
MRALRAWLLRLGASLSGRARRSDVADELNSHLAFHIEDNVRAGMTPAEARRVALIKLGGFWQTAESIREQRGLPFFDTLRQDLVYAVRVLRRNRAFTATAVVTFALGVGANSAIFSIVNAILLRPLPLAEPSQLVMIFATEARRSLQFDGVSYPAFIDWQEQNRSFDRSRRSPIEIFRSAPAMRWWSHEGKSSARTSSTSSVSSRQSAARSAIGGRSRRTSSF